MNFLELEKFRHKNKKICLFGAGKIGRTWACDILTCAGFKIDFYCDNRISAGEEIRDGIRTIDFDTLCNNKEKYLIFVAVNEKLQDEIKKQFHENGIEDYVMMGFLFLQEFCESVLESKDEVAKERYKVIIDDKQFLKVQFRQSVGYELDIDNPKTFNEKLQWLKLYDRNPMYTQMVDKYEFKNFIIKTLGKEYVVPTLGVWDSVEEIEWDKLSEQFVIKCTHDSGSIIECRDKNKFDINEATKKIEKRMARNYFWMGREWPYKDVKPRIIAEKYMQDGERKELRDYKFYCFNGQPKFLYISEGLENHHTARINFITIEDDKWEFAPFRRIDFAEFEELPEKPETYDEMVRVAQKLSRDYLFVRVDLYQINGQIYVSELTFTPGAGFTQIVPEKWDEILGSYIQL